MECSVATSVSSAVRPDPPPTPQTHTPRQDGDEPSFLWNSDILLPASVELHMCIKEANDRSCGGVPAVDPGSDQTLTLDVPHDLHQTRVALVYVLVQVELELHWKRAEQSESSREWCPVTAVGDDDDAFPW